jgi:hypothetical protein
MPCVESDLSFTWSGSSGATKLGHPEPESNFSPEPKRVCPQQTHR